MNTRVINYNEYIPHTEYHGESDLTTGNLKLQDNTEIPLLDKRFLTEQKVRNK